MKISERTVKRLGEIITGDKGLSPYQGGPKLVSFFNEFGTNHTYGQGFPSRWMFAEECIRQFNGTPIMRKIILSAVDPRDFMGATIFDKETNRNKPANLQDALTYLNEFLAFDGYEIVPHGKGYDVVDKTRGEIVVDVKLEPSLLSHAFIMEQRDDFNSDHFSGPDKAGIAHDAIGKPAYRGYLGTPSGKFLTYNPATGQEGELQ